MKSVGDRALPAVAHAVLERLTAIRRHTGAVRRRLRREDPVARAEAFGHLDAIEHHADEAAAQIEPLVDRGGR